MIKLLVSGKCKIGRGRSGMKSTNKTRLVRELARATGVSHKKTKALIDALFEAISLNLVHGSRVVVAGFGSFEVRESRERHNAVPGHADKVLIPARSYPAFRASRTLRQRVDLPAAEGLDKSSARVREG